MRREFWTDRRIALLPKSTRLFYIGLWAVADDAGFLSWDLPQIAGELFPFDSVKRREHDATVDAGRLIGEGRIQLLDCGRHAVIPTLPEHQKHAGGVLLLTVQKEHQRDCSEGLRSTPEYYDRNVTVRNGKERGGTGGPASDAQEARGRLVLVDGKWVAAS